ncbi:10435_t:CDS:2 [Funneliformis mosseae]|uniref:10435_t:CDS:1 n=1 Tax=Funneliformis mosseae TaxID=27381 RepID=A0A9N9ICD9_FUNMO|nr:10435_t:CDS:2 [Funneliformis mosseae]
MQAKVVIDTNKQIMTIKQNNETDVILIMCFSKIDPKVFTPIDFVKEKHDDLELEEIYKNSQHYLNVSFDNNITTINREDCLYCKVLYQDLQEYQIAVSINKAQIEASDKLVEISKGKETPIGNLTKDQQQ